MEEAGSGTIEDYSRLEPDVASPEFHRQPDGVNVESIQQHPLSNTATQHAVDSRPTVLAERHHSPAVPARQRQPLTLCQYSYHHSNIYFPIIHAIVFNLYTVTHCHWVTRAAWTKCIGESNFVQSAGGSQPVSVEFATFSVDLIVYKCSSVVMWNRVDILTANSCLISG